MPKSLFAQILGIGGPIAIVSRLLLGWYLREVRRLKIPEDPGEAIVTYPLA